ncbi:MULTISPECIES: heme ABC exporter ATP-binding protein CcmA [Thalassospira]|jgi:heme exporter protein A|uniref:Heme ABC exporter ATP-binding protein CcmA n=1 Tax=Thalassospira povalilytica TaxID=732237 RepID=A0A8I1M633_9PROT|nr:MULTISPECIES: heme ABC exporter ATP-binding protein CcmA [Thalassospira]MAL40959.1 heme ABC exporter ATP-binding protein CcmA [Thalassospira sp.]MBN8195813.1 heme ABC exporter ATP-binding protein CcmA [Thalassospira povalilytica]MBO6769851.1 heme ABC exporter ATP-binding protein CcmA [Thalassospira sp.]MCC4239378.1 heme ABC exporter ATP-binding protein CcmA [Thalassospira povalilytica]URK17236.1 heme ABC exporter ATP-binding protein CcmA [Thalassospira sp. GO-4]|tara:strand:- start:1602 stop:2303 length:702 start_codon:yes stop_codon:yes gene_type:complete
MADFSGSDLTCLRGERLVFGGLSFAARSGDAIVLRGRNGAGKSSLLRVMAGLLSPRAGQICWDGENILEDRIGHQARLQYLGHQDAVKPVLSVRDNLRLWGQMRGVDDLDGEIDAALDALDIHHLSRVAGRYLSSGQKRRTALARILIGQSDLWLLDEPTVGLDRESCGEVARLIAEFRARGGIVIYSTHIDLDVDAPTVLDLDEFAIPMVEWLIEHPEMDGSAPISAQEAAQ